MMTLRKTICFAACLCALSLGTLVAQEQDSEEKPFDSAASAPKNTSEEVKQKAEQVMDEATKQVDKIAKEVDQMPKAKEISAGILQPIYQLAEQLSFPMFHWLAFAVMATGVVSYALQLVLGKLVVLTKLGFSPAEIISDAHGLLVSVLGLVLTTQASAENSTFTQSPFAVISASAVGIIVGFILYSWGQSQEVQAAMARRAASSKSHS